MKQIAIKIAFLGLVLMTTFVGRADAQLTAGIEPLYWKPIKSYSQLGRRLNATAASDTFPLTADYDWGVRGYARYACNCYQLQVSYLWFESLDRVERTSDANNLQASDVFSIFGNRLNGFLMFQYKNADARGTRFLWSSPRWSFDLFVNGRYLDLARTTKTLAIGGTNNAGVVIFQTFRGAAFGAGFTLQRKMCWGFEGVFEANPILAIGVRKDDDQDFRNGAAPALLTTHLKGATAITPGIDARIGISYGREVRGCDYLLHLGYELNYLWGLFTTSTRFSGGNTPRPVSNVDGIGFAGLTFGLSGQF